jgi:lipoprotein NlpI
VIRTLLLGLLCLPACAQDAGAIMRRAEADFQAGRIAESVRGFDEVAKLRPDIAPQLWQRGIALYYAERYTDCRLQFESHRTVNPNDVENAAWHFLCAAREKSPAEAKRLLLPVGPDARAPMRQVYSMFAGELSPEGVMKAAGSDDSALFYARLYIGLFHEAAGKRDLSLEQMRLAGQPNYAARGGYMHDVALVHLKLRNSNSRGK